MDMPIDYFQDYWLAIDAIEARELVKSYNISSFPYLKASAQKKSYKEMQKIAENAIDTGETKTVSTKSIAQDLARKFSGIK